MSLKRNQADRSTATRAVLLRVARRLFAERGYAATGTEEVVRRARLTRGALYHHFRDKRDLFAAVLEAEHEMLAAKAGAAAIAAPDPWRAVVAASNAFLDACLDPAVQQIVLIDAPAVLGAAQWREADQRHYLASMKGALEAAVGQGLIERQPVGALAHIILGALNEAALLIAHAGDKVAARGEVREVVDRLFAGLRAGHG
jgi:AcrR family transcriptional regulator